jgi:DNA repair protein RecO (recombination protein O)
MPIEESSAAIVLRARDYSESDRIVTLLTRDFGKLSGMAKGAKASRKRFERKLEPFSHVMLYFRRRPNGQLVFVTRAEASPDLPPFAIEDDLIKIALGSYMLELADAFTSEESEAAGAYRVLAEALDAISLGRATLALRQAFELRLLHWAGYGLDFAKCRQCAIAINENGNGSSPAIFFVISRGGVVCARCRPTIPDGALKLDATSAAALVSLAERGFADALEAREAGADGALAISRFMGSVLDRRLRSVTFLDSVLSANGAHR